MEGTAGSTSYANTRAAFFLQPHNFDASMTQHSQEQIDEIFQQYIPDHEKALRQFYNFRDRRGPFNTGSRAWKLKDPSLFWSYVKATCLELAPFAEKLMITCANSVTSEQAWSVMHYIHSKSETAYLLRLLTSSSSSTLISEHSES
jgi:hypothetical protein